MKIYHYCATTGRLVGTGLADADPMTPGNWLVPAYATAIAPPPSKAGFLVVFKNGKWGYEDLTQQGIN